MARVLATQQAGAVIDIRGPRTSTLKVVAPDGLELRIPAPTGKVTLWLPQAGEWTYAWTDGTTGTVTVTPATDQPPAPLPAPARQRRWA